MAQLADRLIEEGWISLKQYNLALEESAKTSRSIWAAIVSLGFLSEEEIFMFFARESGIPFVHVCDYKIDSAVLSLFDENFCIQNIFIPLFKMKNSLFVAFGNPLDAALIDHLAKISNCLIEPLVAAPHAILSALDLYWHLDDRLFRMSELLTRQPAVAGVSMWRESKRLVLELPVKISLIDDHVRLNGPSCLEGRTYNISRGGTAVGLEVFLFLPKGLNVAVEFDLSGSGSFAFSLQVKGEIIYSRMEKSKKYFLGIRFGDIAQDNINKLLKLAEPK